MEEEGSINFKALRARFQEEALMAEFPPSRPAVPGKPKHLPPPPPPPHSLPPPGGHCSFVVSSINMAVEKGTPVVPRVIFKDGLRGSGGKRPISFPPHPQRSPSPQLANGDGTARQSFKDRYMPLVLPALPVKEHKAEVLAQKEHKPEPDKVKEPLSHTKIKKKGLLLPFKSSKATKVNTENVEEPSCADWTRRFSCAPGELPSMEKQSTEDGYLLQSDQSTSDCLHSSPDFAITPPSAETSTDSENRIISTLERAKKKFSRQLISSKPKSLHSSDRLPRGKALESPPKSTESIEPDPPIPPPVCLPHLACISARPFFKVNSSPRKPPSQNYFGRNKTDHLRVRTGEAHHQSAPPKRPLPELRLLGPLPEKPPRPPSLDLSHYRSSAVQEGSPGLSQAPTKEPEVELTSVLNPVLDAPQFPDFENSEVDTALGEAVDIAALELEALDLVSSDLPVPDDFGVSGFDIPLPDWSVCGPGKSSTLQTLNLDNQKVIPVNPASFPEPINTSEFPEPPVLELWSQSEEATADLSPTSHADETDLGAAEFPSVPEETDFSDHAPVNHNSYPSVYQQELYNQTCDNVYEDVENISKFIVSQNLRKRKSGLKNPYADNVPVKEEGGLNIWPRNPWAGVSGEHAHLAPNHINSKEPQSPNTADYKEQKKREKHRLEKEKKEQKEREKKENEMKKKFKVTGEEDPMYHAKVMVACKVGKNDLPVKHGDTVGIIRTTNCPKGKWLARDANRKYGYISVMNVELNIKEMLELGKKAQATGRGCNTEADTISIGSRSSSYPVLTSSFTDDSEEWACEDETLSPSNESHDFPQQTAPMPEMSCGHVSTQHILGDANLDDLHTQTRHEALQKLTVFFQHNEDEFSESGAATPTNAEPPSLLCAVEEPPYPEQEVDFSEMELLPPPPLYADTF